MVWIPGGGFTSGHGGMRLYGPKYLMDKDVVLVTINYRIGILGENILKLYLCAWTNKKSIEKYRIFEHGR